MQNKDKGCLKVLICASTANELSGIKGLDTKSLITGKIFTYNDFTDIMIIGVGYFSSVYYFTKIALLHEYCLVFAVGISGDYRLTQPIPQLYVVESACFADSGFEDEQGNFKPLVGSDFIGNNSFPFNNGVINNWLSRAFALNYGLETCRANTVNRTRTEKKLTEELLRKFPAEIETMESAAIQYVAKLERIPLMEIRATSNHVTPKNIESWHIGEAIGLLGDFLNLNICNADIGNLKRIIYGY